MLFGHLWCDCMHSPALGNFFDYCFFIRIFFLNHWNLLHWLLRCFSWIDPKVFLPSVHLFRSFFPSVVWRFFILLLGAHLFGPQQLILCWRSLFINFFHFAYQIFPFWYFCLYFVHFCYHILMWYISNIVHCFFELLEHSNYVIFGISFTKGWKEINAWYLFTHYNILQSTPSGDLCSIWQEFLC